jgi:membrane-associated protein
LGVLLAQYGLWTYSILFLVIFLEANILFAPFLPSVSLIFTTGTMAGLGVFNVWILFPVFILAGILGDTCNYYIGMYVGKWIIKKNFRFAERKDIHKTKKFFKTYGHDIIIIARFVPIVRTFAPFIAGITKMDYPKFLLYNSIGVILWVSTALFGGYFFGGITFVRENLFLALMIVTFISLIPLFYHMYIHNKLEKRNRRMKR